ncbi:uncharacterized protein PSFLO_05617 [Pseudozyma flocculosa]|uniref:GCF C-terminal domain-containing protein n=1 Tax=Pseudozyma flocculosa TaxID=84751 RepID=A0A5C3F925_9BASI|nr:uncharacterized protein PSFLO_05617 [Pseudozyma flocculosa]
MAMQIDDDGADAAPRDYDDADDDQSLARTKFSADFAHDGIPSESVIRAAKEKRARMRKELLERNGGGFGAGDDFISLGDDYQGPHPESRLQREEDEYGDGEEEYAEYTGATERIPIGKKAEQEYKLQQRREMQEALTDGRSDYAGLADDHEVDEDEEEWERAQLRRTEMPGIKQKQQEHREKSPYRPAEIPLTAPLPTMTSASARLARKMRELEESAEAHATVVEDADKGLEALLQGEKENKEEVVEAEEKESWFRELEQFVTSLAGFMEAKAPRIDDVERDYVDMLVERTRLVQRARAKRMEDELALFWGVPSSSVLPPLPKTGEPDDQQRQQQQQTEQQQTDDLQLEPSPMEDGDFNSAVRLQRQSDAALMAQVDADELSASDAAAFEVAWRALSDRLSSALSDVKAPEYLDVAARLPASSPSSEPSLHPRSVVSRFSEWRRRYPLEYAQAWGGLAIASIWEFYARLEMALSDPLLPSSSSSSSKGGAGLEHYRWHREAIVYAEPSHHDDDDVAAPEGEAAGGDDEILLTIVQNVVLPRLTTLAERAAYDPWDKKQTQAVLRGVQEASYVVDKAGVRFQTLITSYLGLFRQHTTALVESMAGPPGLAAPSIHPSTPAALTGFVRRLITTLLTNLVSWSRHVSPGWHGARTELLGLIDDLLGRVLWPLVVRAKGFGVGGAEAAQRVLELVPHHLVSPDVWARWKALVDNAPL